MILLFAAPLFSADAPSRQDRYRGAVALVREGKYAEARQIVSDALSLPPAAPEVQFDYIVILAQAGKISGAIKLFERLPPAVRPPEYVVKEVLVCYVRQKAYEKADGLYDRYLKGKEGSQSGRDATLDRYLAARQFDLAADYVRRNEKKQAPPRKNSPPRPAPAVTAAPPSVPAVNAEALFRQGEGFEQAGEFIAAYRCYETILVSDPRNQAARNLKYRALARAGCTSLARDMLERTGDRIDPLILQELMGNEAMARLRWEEPDAALRIIAANRRYAESSGVQVPDDFIARCRYDQIAAWQLKGEWQTAVAESLALAGDGHYGTALPPWTLVDIGQSYLSLGKPEEALVLCAVCAQPHDNAVYDDLQMLRYESLIAAGRYAEAHAAAAQYDKTLPAEIIVRGIVRDNWRKEEIARNRGWALASQDRTDEAETCFAALLERAPNNAAVRTALGTALLENGKPAAALEELAVARTVYSDAASETGYCRALYENGRYDEAAALAASLVSRYPQDRELRTFSREINGPSPYEASVEAGVADEHPGATEFGTTLKVNKPVGRGRSVFGEYTWQDASQEAFAASVGRAGLGLEWQAFSVWNFMAMLSAAQGGDLGIAGSVAFRPADILALSCFYDSFSMAVPLQARAHGVTAGEQFAAFRLGPRVGTVLEGKYGVLAMSDGNEQRFADLRLGRRVAASERGRLDLALESAWAGNEMTNVSYFSPASLLSAYLVPEAAIALYRGEAVTVQGRLGVGMGRQWQESFSPRNVWFIRYEQDHRLPGGFTLGAGINYSLQNYDGQDTGVWRLYLTAGI